VAVASTINGAATKALANAMYRHTFGIVVDGKFGAEGQSLGSGIGVLWKGTYLILTADHVVAQTPFERLYFLLPDEALEFGDDDIASGSRTIRMRKRFALEKPEIIESDDDLAAFILPTQAQEMGRNHFYPLDEHHVTPHVTKQIGVLGYPREARVPVGANFMATLFVAFGEMGHPAPSDFTDSESRISISYPTDLALAPGGLSGSGLWLPSHAEASALWNPSIRLLGLTTTHDPVAQSMIGYTVEKLVEFLEANGNRILNG
jgi:hypothetical protein